MNKLVFIESNTSGTGMMALHRAQERGLLPCFVTGSPERYDGLADSGAEILVHDTNDTASIAGAVRDRWPDGIVGVTTTSDFYLYAAATVAAELGLPGNPPRVVRDCRDKAEVRRTFERNGIPQPRFAVIGSPDEVEAAVLAAGLPCVVKPVDGSASENVLLCHDVATARRHVGKLLAVTVNVRGQAVIPAVLVEEYVDGPEYSVEAFGHDGTITCVGVTAKRLGPRPHFVETRHIYPAPVSSSISAELSAIVTRALKTLAFESGPAHVEIRWGADGPAVIEVNARLAGGMIPELIRLADHVDLLDAQLDVAVGNRVDLAPDRSGWAGIHFLTVPTQGVLRSVRGFDRARACAGVTDMRLTAQNGNLVGPARDAYGRVGFIVAHADTADAVNKVLHQATWQLSWEVAPV